MILVDTSVWIDHLHNADAELAELLERSAVLQHPFVVGELALGYLRDRHLIIGLLEDLPAVSVASHEEVLHLVEQQQLHGTGLSFVDAHLLASALLAPGTRLWTRDKRLLTAARRLAIAHGE